MRLHAVKVLEAANSSGAAHGSNSEIVNGINWVVGHAQKPAVANCSFGAKAYNFFGLPNAQDFAVLHLIKSGVVVVVSAGNNDDDANNYSPARVGEAITVGATDINDNRATYPGGQASNWGGAVDVFAPGSNVLAGSFSIIGSQHSAFNGSFSGTSAAAPFVTGVVALYLQTHQTATPAQVHNWITGNATTNRIKSNYNSFPGNTVNRILFTDQ